MNFYLEIIPKMMRYRMARGMTLTPGMPINLTFSVTNQCQSRCKTCKIWTAYQDNPEKRKDELTIDEIEKIFRSMGHIYIFNISGGEPFLRGDLAEIARLACRFLSPGIIHIPTNAIAVNIIEKRVIEILKIIEEIRPGTRLTIKPSLDHIGEKHDEIRGVPGNFDSVMRVFRQLKALSLEYRNLHPELGTVISRWNVNDVGEIARFVKGLEAGSYRNEIAEERAEMFNRGDDISPQVYKYKKAIESFVAQIRSNMDSRPIFQRINNAFRMVYYDLAIRILMYQRQVIPCYAGITNAHLSPYGDVWPCCTLGYDESMGNLRDFNYDFRSLWNGSGALEVRRFIQKESCHCPLANQAYSNIMMHIPSLARVAFEILMGKQVFLGGNSHLNKRKVEKE